MVWTQPAQEERFPWASSRRLIKELYIRTAERFLISFDFFWVSLHFLCVCFSFSFVSAPRRTRSRLTHTARCV